MQTTESQLKYSRKESELSGLKSRDLLCQSFEVWKSKIWVLRSEWLLVGVFFLSAWPSPISYLCPHLAEGEDSGLLFLFLEMPPSQQGVSAIRTSSSPECLPKALFLTLLHWVAWTGRQWETQAWGPNKIWLVKGDEKKLPHRRDDWKDILRLIGSSEAEMGCHWKTLLIHPVQSDEWRRDVSQKDTHGCQVRRMF